MWCRTRMGNLLYIHHMYTCSKDKCARTLHVMLFYSRFFWSFASGTPESRCWTLQRSLAGWEGCPSPRQHHIAPPSPPPPPLPTIISFRRHWFTYLYFKHEHLVQNFLDQLHICLAASSSSSLLLLSCRSPDVKSGPSSSMILRARIWISACACKIYKVHVMQ